MPEGASGSVLRVATYNVRGLKDDRRALARVIRALRPDVLCLQEVPRLPVRRHGRPVFSRAVPVSLTALARAAGLCVAAGGRLNGTAVLASPAVRLLRGRGGACGGSPVSNGARSPWRSWRRAGTGTPCARPTSTSWPGRG